MLGGQKWVAKQPAPVINYQEVIREEHDLSACSTDIVA